MTSPIVEPKVILVIVEGMSDKIALEYPLSKLYERLGYKVFFQFVGGDVTADYNSNSSNILSVIYDRVIRQAFRNYPVNKEDIKEVIHFIDMDGAYIPNENIKQRPKIKTTKKKTNVYKKPFCNDKENLDYDTENSIINTDDKEATINRNLRKMQNINKLYQQSMIDGTGRIALTNFEIETQNYYVPYKLYFMSCNLDHFLYDEPNLGTGREKNEYASHLQDWCRKHTLADFLKCFFTEYKSFIPSEDYIASWDFIKKRGVNSIRRYTNINILLKNLCIEIDDEELNEIIYCK